MRIFFDVDGVLIDGWHADSALRKPWNATIEADLGIDREAFQRLFFGLPARRAASPMFACVTGRLELRSALAEALPQLGYRGGVDSFIEYWFAKDSNLNGEVLALVDEIRARTGAELYVATGQEHLRARHLWHRLGFKHRFDGIFYSAELGLPKKDVGFFEAINRRLDIGRRDRPLFFDDQPEIVAIAGHAGWDGTVFRSPDDIRLHPRLRYLWR